MFSFDTEDDSKGNIYWINFTTKDEENGIFRHYSFKDRQSAIDFISKNPGKYWATNLEYDLCNIFCDCLDIVDWHFGKSKLIWARFKRAYFYDSLNHWRYSVDVMGGHIGAAKLEFNPKDLTYCRRDCEITYEFVERMIKIYENIRAYPKSTIASTSFHFWQTFTGFKIPYRCEGREKISVIGRDNLEKFRLSYYGGRTEVFFKGKVRNNIQYIDVNSMYPNEMRGKFPYPFEFKKHVDLSQYGITYALVHSKIDIPVLPYRNKEGRLIFPNGVFKGVWTNVELNYFVKMGGKILKTYKGYVFPIECDPFTDFVDFLYKKRKEAKTKLEDINFKNILNNTYGKFGQGNEICYLMPYDKFLHSKLKPKTWRKFGNLVLFNMEGEYPYNTNFIWASYITSKARINIHSKLTEIKNNGGKLLYCDTDSVIFQGSLKGIKLSKNLGDFKLEGTFKEFEAKTNKMYRYSGDLGDEVIRCKGVPNKKQAEFFNNNKATYEKPLRLKEALRRDLKPNIWLEHTKVKITDYNKGKIQEDGTVVPFVINEK